MTVPNSRLVAERDGVRLVIVPRSQPGCGDVISHPQSPQLIQGIEIEPVTQFPDERGLFAELFRFGAPGIGRDFDPANGARIQVSLSLTRASSRLSTTILTRRISGPRFPECSRSLFAIFARTHRLAAK
jgi:hypothetical protein